MCDWLKDLEEVINQPDVVTKEQEKEIMRKEYNKEMRRIKERGKNENIS